MHLSVLTQSVYPIGLMSFGTCVNIFVLGAQIDAMKAELGEVDMCISKIEAKVEDLMPPQARIKSHDISIAHDIFKESGEKRGR